MFRCCITENVPLCHIRLSMVLWAWISVVLSTRITIILLWGANGQFRPEFMQPVVCWAIWAPCLFIITWPIICSVIFTRVQWKQICSFIVSWPSISSINPYTCLSSENSVLAICSNKHCHWCGHEGFITYFSCKGSRICVCLVWAVGFAIINTFVFICNLSCLCEMEASASATAWHVHEVHAVHTHHKILPTVSVL